MGQSDISINKCGYSMPVYGDDKYTQVGAIYHREIFSILYTESGTGDTRIHFYSPTGPREGWVLYSDAGNEPQFGLRAYSSAYGEWMSDLGAYKYFIRRQCRIFKGYTQVATIYAGDAIGTDGQSIGGATYPHRLHIEYYRKNGIWYDIYAHPNESGLFWCDTDYEIGYSMYDQITPYSLKW